MNSITKARRLVRTVVPCLLIVGSLSTSANGLPAERVLFDFEGDFDTARLESRDAGVSLSHTAENTALRLATGHTVAWPGITLKAPQGHWDWSSFDHLTLEVRNVGTTEVDVFCRIDTPAGDGHQRLFFQESIGLRPGEKKTFRVGFRRRMPKKLAEVLFGMRGFPGGYVKDQGIDPGNVDQLLIFVSRPRQDHLFEIDKITAGGSHDPSHAPPADLDRLFPLIDRFGQYVHKDWPGKTHSIDDLLRQKAAEAVELAAHPGPEDWNQYGGWEAGPQREASGYFRTEKHRGKWWLVDPQGRLFWSHGSDCVGWTNGSTPITDRTHWFADLPEDDPTYAEFFSRGSWAPHGYYQSKRFRQYNFTGANLLRKYGHDWRQQFAERCHRRLRSWGMNTIANWSESRIYLMQQTPYVVSIGSGRKPIQGSSGYWSKFPDPFDPGFSKSLEKRMESERGKSAGDPWCIGYFVDNELSWGDELSLSVATLSSPAGQAAKRIFIEDLQAKYGLIDRLNQAWGTGYESWEALLESRTPPDNNKARVDLAAFYTRVAEEYFRGCRQAIKQVSPHNLYLGCRFAGVNDRAVRAAAKYCDVVSFNRYRDSVADFDLPDGIDKPAIIGEFHFGALDRGMFHTGLRPVANQDERAEAYTSYVQGALENPWLVGTHWFQYGDQATTGRSDGENYQIGLVDICDTPYPETVQAVRRVGATLYRHRWDSR